MTNSKTRTAPSVKSVYVPGVEFATACSGTKYKKRDDLLMVVLDPGSYVCGCFTVSTMPSAPVIWSKNNNEKNSNLKQRSIFLVNAGNANAFTGDEGSLACEEKAAALSALFNCDKKIIEKFGLLKENLSCHNFREASEAILTTDLKPKIYKSEFKIYNKSFTISGFAKGSGMIFPNMATMLAFIFTDFQIDKNTLSLYTQKAVDESFNRITVDGDTSTSDTVFVSTTNKETLEISIEKRPKALRDFYKELKNAMVNLAKKIVMDGEGAKKFIEITVKNTKNVSRAKKICFSIANSLLVKTAIAGEDANWGRLVMAIGKSKINLDIKKLKIFMQGFLLCENGKGIEITDEDRLSKALKKSKVDIVIDLAEGNKKFTAWTSDLTEEYIRINADYRS